VGVYTDAHEPGILCFHFPAEKDPTIKELGVCPDCEEVFEVEKDYWGWGRAVIELSVGVFCEWI